MRLEDLKAALEERRFEGYLFERPVRQIVLDVQRKARSIEEKHKVRDVQAMLGGIASAPIIYFLVDSRQPWWGNAGIVLMFCGCVLNAALFLRLYLWSRRIRFDLPREEFLYEEGMRLRTRIRILKRDVVWTYLLMSAGLLLFVAGLRTSILDMVILVGLLLVTFGINWWARIGREYKEPESLLSEIEQELAQIKPTGPV